MSRYTEPEWPGSALITIDTQRDTLDGQPFEVPGTSQVLPRMTALLNAYRVAGKPIVHIVRIYTADGANADLCRRELLESGSKLLLAGSPGCQLAKELLPEPNSTLDVDRLLSGGIQILGPAEVVIFKPRWGAFYHTPLEQYLRDNGVTTLVFSGCNFPNCPRTSIYEASERDFRVVLAEDAVSGLYEQGRRELHNIGVDILPTDRIIEAVERDDGLA